MLGALMVYDPRPESRCLLLPESSQDSTVASISAKSLRTYPSAARVWGESSVSLAFASAMEAPNDHSKGKRMELASSHWLIGSPTGCPAFLSFPAARSKSSQVAGGCSPTWPK